MKRTFAFHLSILCASLQLLAQQSGNTFSMERLGTKDGLSHRWMTCIHQDAQGCFWMGTYDGLNRYDGNEFIVYRPSAGGKFPVKADFIYQIAEASDGKFYLSTLDGILCFDPQTGQFELLIAVNKLESVIILNAGRGAPFLEAGILYWAGSTSFVTFYDLLPSGKLTKLASSASLPIKLFPVRCNKEGAWFWDYKGTYHRFDLKTSKWGRFPVAGSPKVPIDPSGTLWLPEHTALRSFVLPQNARSFEWEAAFNIESDKAVWLYARAGKGVCTLLRYDLKNGNLETAIPTLNDSEFIKYGNVQTFRPAQFMDPEGTIWYAGFLGLYKVRHSGNMFQHYLSNPVQKVEAPPSGISVRQMAEDAAGNIYLIDTENDVHKINTGTVSSQKRNQSSSETSFRDQLPSRAESNPARPYPEFRDKVSGMTGDTDGFLWLFSGRKLSRYDPATGQVKDFIFHPQEFIRVQNILDDGNGKIWLPGSDALYRMDKKTGKMQRTPGWGSGALTYAVMLPEENTLWGFTDTGLIKINTLNLEARHIRLYNQPQEQRCLVAHRGWLWIGTSKGLEKVDPKTFAHTNFDRSKGLPGNFVYSMVADGDYLWLGTSDGLCRFHVETGEVKNYFVEDGLSHNEFNTFSTLKARNGRIFMGGLNGVNAFFPDDLEGKTTEKSRIFLSRFSQFDADKDSLIFLVPNRLSEGIELPPSVSSFSFHLAITSYIDPAKNQYAWRMDGLDKDWYYAGDQNVATYRHIPPGSYTFRAKAADSFGNWTEKELILQVTVLRPWYSRWWAWLLYGLLTLGAIFAVYRAQLNKKMEHAERLRLQELDTFKSRFFTNITHEFRTPLTVILGMTERLTVDGGRWTERDSKNSLGLIKRNGESLLRLINQILDLAKLESHTLTINYVQGDVLPYLRYITESLHSFANAQNVMLRVESSEAEIVMDYDPERLLQIVHNLLSNAIKFTPSGGKVTVRLTEDGGRQTGAPPIARGKLSTVNRPPSAVLRVTDTGVGISPEDLSKIFDRFYQAENSAANALRVNSTGGTGIGLSLTKELVKAMGGEISVESEVGKGTTFTVRLPITRKAEDPAQAGQHLSIRGSRLDGTSFEDMNPSPLESLTPQIPTSSTPHLLIIEDNPDVVEYLTACLGENYRLDYAYNGRSGIEKAVETSPDLILSDVMMPEKNGFEVCDFLKNDERTSHIPIVLLTAKADVESRIAGLRKGADAYLAKPFHQEELLVTLQNLLELRRKLQAKYLEVSIGSTGDSLPRAIGGGRLTEDGRTAPITDNQYTNNQLTPDNPENEFLLKLRAIIEADLSDSSLDVDTLCRKTGLSKTNLHNKLSALTGLSTTIYVRKMRLHKAKELLGTTDMNISEIAYTVGFNDPKFFSRVFSEEFGITPREAKRR